MVVVLKAFVERWVVRSYRYPSNVPGSNVSQQELLVSHVFLPLLRVGDSAVRCELLVHPRVTTVISEVAAGETFRSFLRAAYERSARTSPCNNRRRWQHSSPCQRLVKNRSHPVSQKSHVLLVSVYGHR